MRKRINNQMKWVLFGLLCIVIGSGVGFFYHKDQTADGISMKDTQAFEGTQQPVEQLVVLEDAVYCYTDDIQSMLFIGTDQSGNQTNKEEEYHGAMADMLLLLVVNHTQQEYAILQLNRDTITNIHIIDENGEGEACADMQLCTAHWYGGSEEMNCENTVTAVSELLGGIPIGVYYSLSWEGIETLNHVVGGVTVTIQNDFSQVDSSMVEGETITLTDQQAYTFLRGRHGVDDGENLSRMERHRQYLTAWIKKVKEKTADDNAFPAEVYQDLCPFAYTNMKGNEFTKEYRQIADYTNLGIFTIDGSAQVGSSLGDGIEHMEFLMDEASKQETLKALFRLEKTDYAAEDYEEW